MSTQFESLLIRGGRVLRGDLATTAEADLLVERGWIAAIEPAGTITREGRQVFDASDRLLIPGLVNAHTHGPGALAKGLIGDRVPLEVFLNANGAVRQDGHRLALGLEVRVRHRHRGLFVAARDELRHLVAAVVDDRFVNAAEA